VLLPKILLKNDVSVERNATPPDPVVSINEPSITVVAPHLTHSIIGPSAPVVSKVSHGQRPTRYSAFKLNRDEGEEGDF
jgi:hypothetical protein